MILYTCFEIQSYEKIPIVKEVEQEVGTSLKQT